MSRLTQLKEQFMQSDELEKEFLLKGKNVEALRIVKTIKDNTLDELKQYKGQSVEIIILSDTQKAPEERSDINLINRLRGSCPDLPDGLAFQQKIREEWDR